VDVRQGDIVIVELDPTRGSEQQGTQPYLVVQNNIGNKNAPTTIIVPFTISFNDERCPFEVLVTAEKSHLREDSVAMRSQIRTDSLGYLRYLVDSLPEEASTIFDRAEAGLDVLYAPDVVIVETLYEVAFGGEVAGVPLQGNPNDVYRRTVTNGPIDVVALDEHAMAIYASLAEFYEAELHVVSRRVSQASVESLCRQQAHSTNPRRSSHR